MTKSALESTSLRLTSITPGLFTIVSPSRRVSSTLYFPRLYFECEAADVAREHALAGACVDVYHFDRPAVDRARPFRPANRAADGAVGLNRLRTCVDDRSSRPASGEGKEQSGHQCGAECGGVRAVGSVCPHLSSASGECKQKATAHTRRNLDA